MKTFKFLIILFAAISCIAASAQEPLVVAHRGYWKTSGATSAATATESAQNSIRSLCKADSIHCWGSEFDLWMSADGVLFINHDATINGVEIQKSLAKDVAAQRLPNGEYISTLDQYLLEFQRHPHLQAVLEVKPHADLIQESMCVMKALALVEIGAAGMDYHYKVFKAHPEWIQECKKLGLKTNAWTVNKADDLRWCIDQGIDFITTNEPELLQQLLKGN